MHEKIANFLEFHEWVKGAFWTTADKYPYQGDCQGLVAEYLIRYFGHSEFLRGDASDTMLIKLGRLAFFRGDLAESGVISKKATVTVGSNFSVAVGMPVPLSAVPVRGIKDPKTGDLVNAYIMVSCPWAGQKDVASVLSENGCVMWVGEGNADSVAKRHIWVTEPGSIPMWLRAAVPGQLLAPGNCDADGLVLDPVGTEDSLCLEMQGSTKYPCVRLRPSLELLADHYLSKNWGASSKFSYLDWTDIESDASMTKYFKGLTGPVKVLACVTVIPIVDLRIRS